ncbi:type II toxin-antitoxin system PemK/MazF family toxin [Clostridioides difficile]|nr:type II toxin-antitoxin system PemK/MazF family toxin [Clostridioides difficile]
MGDLILKKDVENLKLLDSIIRTTNIHSVKPYKNKAGYEPILKKGYIVQCNFTGLGNELDFLHFAVVWNSSSREETINILPLTSKKKENSLRTFFLGKIEGFITKDDNNNYINKNSYVYISKMMEVSRKRVKLIYKQNNNGKFQKIDERLIPLSIDEKYIKPISDCIKLFYINEGDYLVNILINMRSDYFLDIDELKNNKILELGYRYIEHFKEHTIDEKKIIICFIDGERYSLVMRKLNESNWNKFKSENHRRLYDSVIYTKNNIERRKYIILSLFSNNSIKVNESKKIIKNIFKED